jgi:hypothetical protein
MVGGRMIVDGVVRGRDLVQRFAELDLVAWSFLFDALDLPQPEDDTPRSRRARFRRGAAC